MEQQQNNMAAQSNNVLSNNGRKSKYNIVIVHPHKYLKFIRTPLEPGFPNRKEALKWVGDFVGNTIKESARRVTEKGIDGPFAIEIVSNKETLHVSFSIVRGEFQFEMTDEEEGIAEMWMK